MRTNRNLPVLYGKRRPATAIWMTLLICLSAGCGKRVEYVNGDHKLTRLNQGQTAPRPGILISEGYLSEIFDALGRPKPSADSANSKTAPATAGASASPGVAPVLQTPAKN